MQARHWVILLGVSAMLGSAFSFTGIAVAHIPPVTVAAGRAVLAAIVLWTILRVSGVRLPAPGPAWRPIAVVGITTGAIPYVCLAWGQTHVQSSLAGILFGAVPLFTLVIAHFQTQQEGNAERMTPLRIAGVIAGFAGVGAILGPGALAGLDGQLLGETLILAGAACYGFGSVYTRRNARHAPLVMAAAQNLCAAAILVPLSIAFDAPWRLAPEIDALVAVAALAVIGTAVPAPAIFWLIRSLGAITTSLLAYFIPLTAALIGVLVLGETLSFGMIAGFALILGGATLVSRRPAPAAAAA
jgi:drug/metabolite transporter (DMT)-like permease